MFRGADEVFFCDREHPTCSRGGIVNRSDRTWNRERVVVPREDQVDHEPDCVAGCEVLTGRLIGGLVERANQIFVEVAHLCVGDLVRVQVYARELLDDDEEQILLRHPGNLVAELEPLEDVEVVRESIDVLLEVGLEPCGVAE